VDHLLSSCTTLAAIMYLQRHDRVRKIIHCSILKRFNFFVSRSYWDHVPAAVVEAENSTDCGCLNCHVAQKEKKKIEKYI